MTGRGMRRKRRVIMFIYTREYLSEKEWGLMEGIGSLDLLRLLKGVVGL
jgi:hypothetical protein